MEWIDSLAPDRFRESVALLKDPALRAFYDQKFARFDWYDLFPMLPLAHAAARLQGMEFLAFCRLRTRLQAIEDTQGVLKLFLKVASLQLVALKLPRIAGFYFDFGRAETTKIGPRHVQSRRAACLATSPNGGSRPAARSPRPCSRTRARRSPASPTRLRVRAPRRASRSSRQCSTSLEGVTTVAA